MKCSAPCSAVLRHSLSAKQSKTDVTPEKGVMASANQTPGGYKFAPLVASQQGRASEPARARLLWGILSLVLPAKFGHTTACRSPALAFSAAINFAMKCSAPCSAVLRHCLSAKQNKTNVTPEKGVMASANQTPGGYKYAPLVASQQGRASEPARARLLWAILSLVLPAKFGHTTAGRSPALAFSVAIHFAMKCSAPCSAVLRHCLSERRNKGRNIYTCFFVTFTNGRLQPREKPARRQDPPCLRFVHDLVSAAFKTRNSRRWRHLARNELQCCTIIR